MEENEERNNQLKAENDVETNLLKARSDAINSKCSLFVLCFKYYIKKLKYIYIFKNIYIQK